MDAFYFVFGTNNKVALFFVWLKSFVWLERYMSVDGRRERRTLGFVGARVQLFSVVLVEKFFLYEDYKSHPLLFY
jgi:hypothetical protein